MLRRTWALSWCVGAALLFFDACQTTPTYSVEFLWPDGGPPQEALWVFARATPVYPDGGQPETANPVPIGLNGKAAVPVLNVPIGVPSVLSVTMCTSAEACDPRVEYYGQSQPFTLQQNEQLQSPIQVPLLRPPAGGSISIGTPPASYVNTPAVDLVLVTDTGKTVRLGRTANDLSTTLPLQSPLLQVDAGTWLYPADGGWSLLNGLPSGGCDVQSAQQGCPFSVFAEFADDAGKEGPVVQANVTLDLVAPQLILPTVTPTNARQNETLIFTITPNEPLRGIPDAAVQSPPGTSPIALAYSASLMSGDAGAATSGTVYYFSYDVLEPGIKGTYSATFTLTDLAGNVTRGAPDGGILFGIDSDPPVLSAAEFDDAGNAEWTFRGPPVDGGLPAPAVNFSEELAYSDVYLWFNVSKPVDHAEGSSLVVRIGGRIIPCNATSQETPPNYVCVYNYSSTAPLTAGTQPILITATDEAGNIATATTSVTIDYTPPQILAATFTPNPIQAGGQTATLDVTASKVVLQPMVTCLSSDVVAFPCPGTPQPSFGGWIPTASLSEEWTRELSLPPDIHDGGVDGEFNFSVQVQDDVGHSSVTDVRLDVSQDAPVISGVYADGGDGGAYSAVPGWNNLVIEMHATWSAAGSAAAGGLIAVLDTTCDGGPCPQFSCVPAPTPGDVDLWACTYNPGSGVTGHEDVARSSTNPQGANVPVTIVATDRDGNITTAETSVRLDFNPPGVVSGSPLVSYRAGATNLINKLPGESPIAATLGTTIDVSFLMDEPLTGDPQVFLSQVTGPTRFSKAGSSGESYDYDLVWGGGLEDNPGDAGYGLQVLAVDTVGNSNLGRPEETVTFGASGNPRNAIWIDTTEPATPAVVAEGPILYTRVPWGDQNGGATFTVSGTGGAVEPGSFVIPYDGPDPTTAAQLNSVIITADGDGGFGPTGDLNPPDRPIVYLLSLDEAGNPSNNGVATAVHNVTLKATFNGKVSGQTGTNPNLATGATDFLITQDPTTARWSGTLGQSSTFAAELLSYAGLASLRTGGSTASLSATPTAWLQLGSSTWPLARTIPSIAYDSARGVLVLFGGGPTPPLDETWEWDGTSWHESNPVPPTPPARFGHVLVYDAARGATLAFGGCGAVDPNTFQCTSYLDDTWLWDGSSWSQVAAGPAPSPRAYPGATYDSDRGVIVLFGGQGAGGVLSDTWEWNGLQWTQVASAGPGASCHSALSYDPGSRTTLLVGGATLCQNSSFSSTNNQTWEWNGLSWSRLAPGAVLPNSWADLAMAYDAALGHPVMVMVGTSHVFSSGAAVTWEWAGGNWRELNTTFLYYPDGIALAYDTAHKAPVMLYDSSSSGAFAGLWQWNGSFWDDQYGINLGGSNPAPPATIGNAAAYVPAQERTLLVGAGDWYLTGGWLTAPYETWEHEYSGVANDRQTGDAVLFGGDGPKGALGDTWILNQAGLWNLETFGGPPARYYHAMATDANGVVLFGGEVGSSTGSPVVLGDTWEWQGSSWAQQGGGPSARFDTAMAYDEARGTTVLFGGTIDGKTSALGDTWEWVNGSWSYRSGSGPGGRYAHSMTYDTERGVTMLFGGASDASGTDDWGDTWEWNGSTQSWTNVTPVSSTLTPRSGQAMAYDPLRQQAILFGGTDARGKSIATTWVAPSDPNRRAAVVLQFNLETGEPQTDVRQISLTGSAGGVGYGLQIPGNGSAQSGAMLLGWDAWSGSWRSLAVNGASASNATPLKYPTTTQSATEAKHFVLAAPSGQSINFAYTTVTGRGNGTAPPVVAVGNVELIVSYVHAEDPALCTGSAGSCPDPLETYCGGQACVQGTSPCANLTMDVLNCGMCGTVCPAGTACVNGSCGGCLPTQVACDGVCTDTANSSNCGTCGNVCTGGTVCCPVPGSSAAFCANTQEDSGNCGGCNNPCPVGATCSGGNCQCPPGQSLCNGACINTSIDSSNCGCGGFSCEHATECNSNSCICPGTEQVCANTSANCTDTLSDSRNCGDCLENGGKQCANGGWCDGGVCDCPTGETYCPQDLDGDGECVPLNTNTDCGACGVSCVSPLSCAEFSVGGVLSNVFACQCLLPNGTCDNSCVPLDTPANCGTCDTNCLISCVVASTGNHCWP